MLSTSVLDLFTIGIGPSSSHTVGPMKAAKAFIFELQKIKKLEEVKELQITLYGSLAWTGKGHGSDKAVLMGLLGFAPDKVDPKDIDPLVNKIKTQRLISLNSNKQIPFDFNKDIIFNRKILLPLHPNGLTFQALDSRAKLLLTKNYYSVGGGFLVEESSNKNHQKKKNKKIPYPYSSAKEALEFCEKNELNFSSLIFENECTHHSKEYIINYLRTVISTMIECYETGLNLKGPLPGGLKVKRRAPDLYKELLSKPEASLCDPLTILDWVNLYAISVNEVNASHGRVVTAPTNGAAGIIPAVLLFIKNFQPQINESHLLNYLITAGGIGLLYKMNASISGAEVGCQGEVGVACSMAAAGLTEVLGGTPRQVENAAEIAMEHSLGLTCDPIGGLVQIPCIERNAIGAVKAINAARMALRGDGSHFVSLDQVIDTMKQTGLDMKSKYKETSRGGLAASYIEC